MIPFCRWVRVQIFRKKFPEISPMPGKIYSGFSVSRHNYLELFWKTASTKKSKNIFENYFRRDFVGFLSCRPINSHNSARARFCIGLIPSSKERAVKRSYYDTYDTLYLFSGKSYEKTVQKKDPGNDPQCVICVFGTPPLRGSARRLVRLHLGKTVQVTACEN